MWGATYPKVMPYCNDINQTTNNVPFSSTLAQLFAFRVSVQKEEKTIGATSFEEWTLFFIIIAQ